MHTAAEITTRTHTYRVWSYLRVNKNYNEMYRVPEIRCLIVKALSTQSIVIHAVGDFS